MLDEDLPEMKWSRETKRAELFTVPTGTQKITVYVLVVYVLQGQPEMKEKKNEELHNACTRTLLRIGNLPTFKVGDLQRDPPGTSKQLMMAKTHHLLSDVAEHFARGAPEPTCSDGKHESRLACVFANAAALRAVRRFEMSQEQVVPKHKLLMVKYTTTQIVMVKQIKLDAPDQNKLEKDFGNLWEGKRRRYSESCERCANDEAWETLSDAYREAFLKQQNERVNVKKTAGKGRVPRFVREPVCQKPTPGVEGGDASKDACAFLTSAVTKTLWKDRKRMCKEKMLTALVGGAESMLPIDCDGQECAAETRRMERPVGEGVGQEP